MSNAAFTSFVLSLITPDDLAALIRKGAGQLSFWWNQILLESNNPLKQTFHQKLLTVKWLAAAEGRVPVWVLPLEIPACCIPRLWAHVFVSHLFTPHLQPKTGKFWSGRCSLSWGYPMPGTGLQGELGRHRKTCRIQNNGIQGIFPTTYLPTCSGRCFHAAEVSISIRRQWMMGASNFALQF